MSEIKIYQGNQIGGCVTLISTEVAGITHRIMIDYGSSLPGSDTAEDFEYPWEDEPVDAVFFTHYHGDHVGRLMEIPANVPIYMGNTARKVMINIQTALSKINKEEETANHKEALEILNNHARIHTFKWNGHYYNHIKEIPGFKIEPYSVDHSAYDAYMFLIEADDTKYPNGKRVILHTGDFRGHGWRGKAMLPVIQSYVHKKGRKVNSLIIEGTMMSRMDEEVKTETEMMYEAAKYLKEHKYAFLICSSTNLDSLASFYQAAQMASVPFGRYLYIYNSYYKEQLKTFSATAGGFSEVYQFKNVHELDLTRDLKANKWKKSLTQKELMEKTGFLAIIKPEEWCEKYIEPFVQDYKDGKIDQMPVIIYSMWDGYIKEYREEANGSLVENKTKNQAWIDFLKKQEEKRVEIKHLHTSGHASPQMLAEVIKAVAPTDEIYPMHTEHPEMFKELDIGEFAIKLWRYENE
ncbi:MAG: MBL fold metallo-hydrolase [Lachnospiraceae bacterium]|nr:MBL fold metallo-hydrolase [Lachnospiraceae bacterium]